ncbi:MAG: Resolvase, partial [Candidatus Magasanikbacteria bacterium GW2011_GWA2_46_17]
REMFELYSTGNHSTLSLVKEMYKKGLRNRTGRTVGKSRLHEMLSDPFYCGNIRWKNVVTKGSQNPIITRQIFEKVQLILGRKLKNPQYRKHLPVFKAKLRCIECEGTITWETQKGHWYGHCNHHRACNQKKWVRQEKVEEQLFPLFDRVAPKNKRVLQWLKEALKEVHTTESTVHTERREEIARSIALADKRMERLYVDKLDGVVDNALYQKVNEDTKKEKAALLEAQEGLNEDQSAYYEAGYAIHELAAEAQAIYESPKATLNKNFEPRQKGAKCDILRSPFVMTPTELVGESLEPRNKFRTSKNPFFNVRFGNLDAKSGTLLPG